MYMCTQRLAQHRLGSARQSFCDSGSPPLRFSTATTPKPPTQSSPAAIRTDSDTSKPVDFNQSSCSKEERGAREKPEREGKGRERERERGYDAHKKDVNTHGRQNYLVKSPLSHPYLPDFRTPLIAKLLTGRGG